MMVREMQRKLSLKAEKDRDHVFGDLYSLLCRGDWLAMAWEKVKSNKGSRTAGVDRTTRSARMPCQAQGETQTGNVQALSSTPPVHTRTQGFGTDQDPPLGYPNLGRPDCTRGGTYDTGTDL